MCFFLLQKESWVRRLSCNLSAGEVEMGWGSLEFSCPPALHNHLISEPRVSSYSASTSKVDSTESRTVETFEWPASSCPSSHRERKARSPSILPRTARSHGYFFLLELLVCRTFSIVPVKGPWLDWAAAAQYHFPFLSVLPQNHPPNQTDYMQICIPGSTFFFFFFWESQGKDHRTSTSFIFP